MYICYDSTLDTMPERAQLLEDVIDNIEREGDYYSKCNLTFGAKEHELLTDTGLLSVNFIICEQLAIVEFNLLL